MALITLLLGTGIRVSECVGLNLSDVDFKNDGIRVHRKGGKEQIVYFGDEVEEALLNYMEERMALQSEDFEEQALFLSLQQKRLSVRSIEKLVKKYALVAAPLSILHRINCEVLTAPRSIVKPGIFIWSRMFWDTVMSTRPKSIMRPFRKITGAAPATR